MGVAPDVHWKGLAPMGVSPENNLCQWKTQ
jgi:hypothetical protein